MISVVKRGAMAQAWQTTESGFRGANDNRGAFAAFFARQTDCQRQTIACRHSAWERIREPTPEPENKLPGRTATWEMELLVSAPACSPCGCPAGWIERLYFAVQPD